MSSESAARLRIATVSDLHTDFPENREALVKLAVAIHHRGADLVVVAGDVSHRFDRVDRALRAFREVAPRVAYVPGNHEMWFDVPFARVRPELDSWQRYRADLRKVAEDAGAHYLPAGPLILGEVAIAGTCGWYDYSLMLPAYRTQVGLEALEAKQFGGVMWSDLRYVAFRHPDGRLMTDPEVAAQMEFDLSRQLEQLDADPTVEEIVVVTHHQPFSEIVHRTGTLPWEYFNAFMGSAGLGETIIGSAKVRTAVYGHTHLIGSFDVRGIRVFGTALGYPRERRGLDDEALARTRIGWIER